MKQGMMKYTWSLLLALGFLASCSQDEGESTMPEEESQAPNQAEVAQRMLDSLGGEEALRGVNNIVLEGGSGTRNFLGQRPATGEPDTQGSLSDLREVIDLENGRAAFNNAVSTGGGFEQQRTEALTRYNGEMIGWGTTNGRPNHVTSVDGLFSWSTHNTPATLLRRNPVTMALTAADIDSQDPAEEAMLDGGTYWRLDTMREGEDVSLYVDQENGQLAAWEVLDTETMRGDKQAVYFLGDYRQVDGLMLPHSLRIMRDGELYADLQYEQISVNNQQALSIFEVPQEVTEQADQVAASDGSWVSLEWNEIADGVYHIVAFSHHSMVVEFQDFVAVVEAPYTQGQSQTLARQIEERIGKPIRYVVPTHPHYDHTGGVRALVAEGADVLTAEGHEEELRTIVESPHSNPSDLLAERREAGDEVGSIETFSGMTEISDGERVLELHALDNLDHVKPMVIALDTQTGVLFTSDLFFGFPGADVTALYEAIQERNLEVSQMAGGHGGPFPWSALEEAATSE